MPRRYGADGTRLWNGKTPEEFTEADAYRFMAETEAVLQKKELMDDPAQPAPASGKEEFYLSKKDDVLLTPEQIAAEERRWLFDAPIAELAEVKGVSMAYQRRLSRHKAQYSLDCDDGIEYSACLHEPTPQELLERMETFLRLWNALNSLPEIQGRRIDAHIILGKSIKEIAKAEGVHEESIRQSIKRGLERMRKTF